MAAFDGDEVAGYAVLTITFLGKRSSLFGKSGFQGSGQNYNLDAGDAELVYFKAPTP